jgi:hypothetical protein
MSSKNQQDYKTRVCLSLKQGNVTRLNESKGLASLSAYLDYVVDEFYKNGGKN